MPARIARRLAILVASLLGASVLIFVVCSALPGDVALTLLGEGATPAQLAALRAQLGTDRPAIVQYLAWLGGMLQGNLGSSYLSRQAVASVMIPRLAVTFWLVTLGVLVALAVAVPLGTLAAVRRRRWQGFVANAVGQVGMAIPAFWGGLMLVGVFSVGLRWLPANGYVPLTSGFGPWLAHLVLPVLSLGLVQGAVFARYVRAAIVEVLNEDYLRTARAVGWTQSQALVRHGVRNAALSLITVLGVQVASSIVGAIVIESVFALPGVGSLLLSAVLQRDLIVVQGVVMFLVVVVLVINALVDVSYVLIDPRLKARAGARP